jgi:hypothetical protein
MGVTRVVPHDFLEQQVRDWRQAHRSAGMPVANVLHCVGGQYTYGVDGSVIKLGPPLWENRV